MAGWSVEYVRSLSAESIGQLPQHNEEPLKWMNNLFEALSYLVPVGVTF